MRIENLKASVKELESEGTRLHSHWHAAEVRANVAEARLDILRDRIDAVRSMVGTNTFTDLVRLLDRV